MEKEKMKKRLICLISGRVQGVLYRRFTKKEADRIGINGTVENLQNGTVRVEAEGEEEKLDIFRASLQKGPTFSKVENVVCEYKNELLNFDSFKIKYGSFFDYF